MISLKVMHQVQPFLTYLAMSEYEDGEILSSSEDEEILGSPLPAESIPTSKRWNYRFLVWLEFKIRLKPLLLTSTSIIWEM